MFFYPSIGIRAPVLRCKHLTVFRKDSGREKRFSKRWLVMNTHLHLALLSNTTEMVTMVILDHQFDGEKFEYWKDKLESYFLGLDADLWDLLLDGYKHPLKPIGVRLTRSEMT